MFTRYFFKRTVFGNNKNIKSIFLPEKIINSVVEEIEEALDENEIKQACEKGVILKSLLL